jgi:hypothetical protein
MGYDLYFAEPTGAMATAKRKADWAYQNQAEDWFNMPQPYYYRYSIWGGQNMRGALEACGLLTNEAPEGVEMSGWGPKFPKYNAETMPEGSPEEAAYRAEVDALINRDFGGIIPAFKLGSNDGWLVTPAEIQRGIDRGLVDEGLKTLDDAYDRAFVRWVIRSIKHGGFRVF